MNLTEITLVVWAGVFGTTAMTLFMSLIHRANIANADMVRALGSVFIRKELHSYAWGLLIHYVAGIFFALLYAFLVWFSPSETDTQMFFVCMAAGFFHGLVMSMLLVIAVAEHHPLPRFRKAGIDVVISHLAGHVVYGITVGFCFAGFDLDPNLLFQN